MFGGLRHQLAAALVCSTLLTAQVALVADAASPSPTPATMPPASGIGSVSRVLLSDATETATRCMAGGADGAVWVLEAGRRLQLVRVGNDGAVNAYPIPGAGAAIGADAQCLTVAGDGGVWVAGAQAASLTRFDPTTHAVSQLATPPGGRATEVAAGPNGVLWFDDFAAHTLGRIDASGHLTEHRLPGAVTFGPYSLTVTDDGHVWAAATGVVVTDPVTGATLNESILEFDAEGTLLHQLAAAQSPVGAISIGLHAYVIATGPGGRPFFGWGPYPYGVGLVRPSATVQLVGWPGGDIPSAMVLGPDGRLWFVIPNGNLQNFGYIAPGTLAVRLFHGPKGLAPGGLAAGPGTGVSFTAGDNYLYRVDTGVTSATSTAFAPLSIAASLPTPAQAFGNGVVVVTSVALAVGGTLFITFPAQLFNLTFQENYPAIAGWLARRRHHAVSRPRAGRNRVAFALVVATGALLGSLLDPTFARGWSTVAGYLAIALALLTGAAVSGAAAAFYHQRTGHPERPYLLALPLGLAIAAVCVLVSRLASFQPGYLYGVVCVLAFHRRLDVRAAGQVAAVSCFATLVASVVAWLVWVPVNHAATQAGAWFGAVFADDFLAAVFVGGLVGSAIGLLPLRFLPGGAIRQWSPPVWAALFATAMFGVIDFLLRSPVSPGTPRAPLATTIVLFLAFGGAAVAFREYFARRWRAEHGVVVRGVREWARDLLAPHVGPSPTEATPQDPLASADTTRTPG